MEPHDVDGNNAEDIGMRQALAIALLEAAETGERNLCMLKTQALLAITKRMT